MNKLLAVGLLIAWLLIVAMLNDFLLFLGV